MDEAIPIEASVKNDKPFTLICGLMMFIHHFGRQLTNGVARKESFIYQCFRKWINN